ncbi:MAG: molybdopterin cofactor-binding domain-containing protein [Beijerinckiaceae bacterium]
MNHQINRRHFLAGTGALTVAVLLPGAKAKAYVPMQGTATRPALDPKKLASYISVNTDGSVVAYFGKMDMGQGTDVGVAQMVAEELDLHPERVHVPMGDTAITVNQGGASGSTGVSHGGKALKNAAAEARLILAEMASKSLGVPVESLVFDNGVISAKDDPKKRTSFGELIGGRWFTTELEWNGKYGNQLLVTGRAKPKDPKDYKVYGMSPPRRDVAGKVLGTQDFVTDIEVPGMLHGRTVFPPVAGSVPVKVDAASIANIAGAQVVHVKDLLGVVAPREWDAIKAAKQLKVEWSKVDAPFVDQKDIYDHIRKAKAISKGGAKKNLKDASKVEAAFKSAARIVEATYEWPYQSHASMGPACAVVDYRPDGTTTLWTGSQKPHYAAEGVARILGLKAEQVHGVWVPGPGSYGRNDAGDAAMIAAVMSKAAGKPVRYQMMRHEGSGWDPKAPASVHTVRAGLDKDNNVVAWHFHSKSFDRLNVNSNESNPADNLAGQMLGHAPKPRKVYNTPAESYKFPVKHQTWEVIAPMLETVNPLRSSHLRDPLGPEIHFANESFIDEVAYATGMDPMEFRIKHAEHPRDVAILKAAAEKFGWKPHNKPQQKRDGDIASGYGVAYAQRNGTRVAIIAEVDVNLKTGKVLGKRFVVGHDCGIVINPQLLNQTIEGNICQAFSRATYEEVKFSKENVTSVDWESYPIMDIMDTPASIEIVHVNRPDLPPTGAGEGSMRPVAGAIANAIYDATGIRIRQAPFTPDRIKARMV